MSDLRRLVGYGLTETSDTVEAGLLRPGMRLMLKKPRMASNPNKRMNATMTNPRRITLLRVSPMSGY